jgi:hypothetical protein
VVARNAPSTHGSNAATDRTAPYWRHIMVIDVYAATADGVWLYDPKRHALLPHLKTDIRPATPKMPGIVTGGAVGLVSSGRRYPLSALRSSPGSDISRGPIRGAHRRNSES